MHHTSIQSHSKLTLDGHNLTIDEVSQVAARPQDFAYDLSAQACREMARSRVVKDELIADGVAVYGVTTGFGDSSARQVSPGKARALQRNLLRVLLTGLGQSAPDDIVRATMLIRANSMARGRSGIREEPVRLLLALLAHDLLPVVPERGSVGASGDLVPLGYIASALTGEGTVRYGDRVVPAMQGLLEHGLSPAVLEAKEGLALVNGTSFMAAYAVLALSEATELAWTAELCTALAVEVRQSPAGPFAPFPHQHKPHPGQIHSAAAIMRMLEGSGNVTSDRVGAADAATGYAELERRVQDPYSIRCAPQVIGVLRDTLSWAQQWLTVEINSANDNPLFDAEGQMAYNSGNFYGGHVAQAAQALTSAEASIADLMDRQLQLMVDEKYNLGLPPNLIAPVAAHDPNAGLHHGFKAAQLTASALTAEALHLTMPAASFSRSTESHNQDKVSMGSIAARHARTAAQLATDVAAIHLLALTQACDIRGLQRLSPLTRLCRDIVRQHSTYISQDRPLEPDIRRVATLIRTGALRRAIETDKAATGAIPADESPR
jgi:histidine ammonia-lyase/phenylalanine ammonia-lyase